MSTHTTRDVAPSPYRDGDAAVQHADPARLEVHETEPVQIEPARHGWWRTRTALEKIGVVALGLAAGAVGLALAAPRFVKSLLGGGMTGGGAWLLREGFRKKEPDGQRRR